MICEFCHGSRVEPGSLANGNPEPCPHCIGGIASCCDGAVPTVAHDPGGKVRLRLQPGVRGDALFSSCGRYRHWLSRKWGEEDAPYALWIGMNPSTAEADIDDPTICREVGHTRRMGLTSYYKCNVMDYRATAPRSLLMPGVEPRSPHNLAHIVMLACAAERVILAYGVLHRRLRHYTDEMISSLGSMPLWCMGMTADGSPRHPLYLRGDTELLLWSHP